MRLLVFIHGRSQELKQASQLKREWTAALDEGLQQSSLPATAALGVEIDFAYYGQALYDLVGGLTDEQAARVVVRDTSPGAGAKTQSNEEQDRVALEIAREICTVKGVSPDVIDGVSAETLPWVINRGIQNWPPVLRCLAALDRHCPWVSTAAIATLTQDVYQYVRNPGVRDAIDEGVSAAMRAGEPTVVVSHSLGTIVAYSVLKQFGHVKHWEVPLLITLGSPLGITAIRKLLSPIKHPVCVGAWYNARDAEDVVALNPLDSAHFAVRPTIEDTSHVINDTPNKHGIVGYLKDATVARRIYGALHGDEPQEA